MAIKKHSPVTYKREKNKVEISGDPSDVKWQIWFDLAGNKLLWVALVIVLLCTVPKASIIPVLWKLLKKLLPFLVFLPVVVGFIMLRLSG